MLLKVQTQCISTIKWKSAAMYTRNITVAEHFCSCRGGTTSGRTRQFHTSAQAACMSWIYALPWITGLVECILPQCRSRCLGNICSRKRVIIGKTSHAPACWTCISYLSRRIRRQTKSWDEMAPCVNLLTVSNAKMPSMGSHDPI
jgi:hypothetical protein